MTPTQKRIIVASISVSMACFLFIFVTREDVVPKSDLTKAMPVAAVASPTSIPLPEVYVSHMDSPEGSKTLEVERVESSGLPLHSVFVVSQSDGALTRILHSDVSYQNLSIPFNTWSPDTVYFFLKEQAGGGDDYLVFQSSGENFAEGKRALSVQQLFQEQIQGFIIGDVTGWAAPTLLLVNTRETNGEGKVSFWFEVPSQTFIQLGTYFK